MVAEPDEVLDRPWSLLALAQEHLGLCVGIFLGLAVGAGLATVYFQ